MPQTLIVIAIVVECSRVVRSWPTEHSSVVLVRSVRRRCWKSEEDPVTSFLLVRDISQASHSYPILTQVRVENKSLIECLERRNLNEQLSGKCRRCRIGITDLIRTNQAQFTSSTIQSYSTTRTLDQGWSNDILEDAILVPSQIPQAFLAPNPISLASQADEQLSREE
jgi:hypothetical protein